MIYLQCPPAIARAIRQVLDLYNLKHTTRWLQHDFELNEKACAVKFEEDRGKLWISKIERTGMDQKEQLALTVLKCIIGDLHGR